MFDGTVEHQDPGFAELKIFLTDTYNFIGNILEDTELFGFLWEEDESLHDLAVDTFTSDVHVEIMKLHDQVEKMPFEMVQSHGLQGRPLYFKFKALHTISSINIRERLKGQFSVRGWLKRVFSFIDTILDSIIAALGLGVGGLVKEFKDTLSALA